jgi:hypothetical protein
MLNTLRDANTALTMREIAAQLAARYQLDASNTDAMKALIAKVRNALARQKGLSSEMRADEGLESGGRGLAPRPPFAILAGANQT